MSTNVGALVQLSFTTTFLDGSINVGLAMSRKEIFLPVATLFCALTDISEREVHELVLQEYLQEVRWKQVMLKRH